MPISQMFLGAGLVRPTLTFVGFLEEITNVTTVTFAGASIGADRPKLVIVGVNCNDSGSGTNPTISSASIGGVGATLVCNAAHTDRNGSFLFQREMSGGATADISFTYNNNINRTRIAIWTLWNYQSATPFDTLAAGNFNATSTSGGLDIPNNGATIGCIGSEISGYTFSDWTSKTTHEASQIYDGAAYSGFASDTTLAAATARTFTVSTGGASDRTSWCMASWR